MIKQVDWEVHSILISSTYRVRVLKTFGKKPISPSTISQLSKLRIVHVSRTLKELLNLGLVECITPSRRKGKLYYLTKDGQEHLEILKE